jgi:uncharacterized protein YndB with AHSA1/START domain
MPEILHRVGINVKPKKVFAALTSIEGLRHWWTTETSGDTTQGAIINFGFCDMKVVTSQQNKLVKWKCVRGPKDWIGTEVSFQLRYKDNQTFVIFKHANWKKSTEFMHHCSTKWATFLLSLRNWLERAEGRPSPYDIKIHVGD